MDLNISNVKKVPKNVKGIYAIRKTKNVGATESDIIYIGHAGTGAQGVGQRLRNLIAGLESDRNGDERHSASPKIKRHIKAGLQFSWLKCSKSPDGVEKAFLLAFNCSMASLPVCNDNFRG
jgi:hypothetical protein